MKKIGVFDSGIGGLTVLKALRRTAPELDVVFLGDLARSPYGVHDAVTVLGYSRDNAAFLLREGVEAIVIACNTATAASLETLRQELDVPVWGVIDPAAEAAARASKSGRIAVIATEGTVRGGSYERKLLALRPEGEFTSIPCQNLVALIEGGVGEDEEAAVSQCREYLAPLEGRDVDTLILGCTHFPMYRNTIQKLLPGVELIDTGEALSAMLEDTLSDSGGSGRTDYCVTKYSDAFDMAVHKLDEKAAPGCVRVVTL